MKGLQKSAVLSIAAAVVALGMPQAIAGGPYNSNTAAGLCTVTHGATDTCTGHISGSIVGTLSVNEVQAINFGNVAVTGAFPFAGDGLVTLNPSGAIGTPTAGADGLTLVSGASAGGYAGNGGQHPGIYTIAGAAEGGQTRVYISFADTGNNPVDCNGDSNYPGTFIPVFGPPGGNTFRVNQFTFTESGKDVYGHYISAASSSAIQVPVGATLRTDPASAGYPPGKYVGEFNIMVSY